MRHLSFLKDSEKDVLIPLRERDILIALLVLVQVLLTVAIFSIKCEGD